MASAAARERYARKNEAEDLTRAFNALDRKGDGKLDPEELQALFSALGHKPKRGEVEDLIWEVDEDCDGCISWQEFQRLYHRCRQDSTGMVTAVKLRVAAIARQGRITCLNSTVDTLLQQSLNARTSQSAQTASPPVTLMPAVQELIQ